jgi:hypothetical protein
MHGAKTIKFIAGKASIYFKFPNFQGMQHCYLHGQAAQGLKMRRHYDMLKHKDLLTQ